MDNFNIDVEDFITEIENHPVVWNTHMDDYGNKIIKRKVWEEIVQKYVPGFENKGASDKDSLVTLFQRKWKSLRDCFTRELANKKRDRLKASRKRRRQYIYFDRLAFLQQAQENVGEMDDVNSTEIKLDEISIKDESISDNTEMDNIMENIRIVQESNGSQHNENSVINFLVNKALKQDYSDDEDRCFMMSLVSELKRVPPDMKLEVKGELINVFKQARIRSQGTVFQATSSGSSSTV